jgi:Ca-activated chloride channel family protein
MEFLNPTALYGLLALPLLLIPYMIRRKPQRVVFSSLLLFVVPDKRARGRPLGKLRLPPIFFLQFLLLTVVITALAEPVFSVRSSKIAIVFDNSASMQTLFGQQTRFALAQEKARGLLADLGPTATADLYLTVPRLAKVRGASFGPVEAGGVLATLASYDLPDAPIDYQAVLSQMAQEQKYDRVYLITDHPAMGQTDVLRVITVGQPRDNFAITAFNISRSSLVDSRLEATADIANFSGKVERIRVVLRSGERVLSSRELVVEAGKTAKANFAGLPHHRYYELQIDNRDGLAVDNRRFAVPPATQNLRILGVSPRPQALQSLRSIPGVSLDLVAPQEYDKTDRTGYGLEIFHYATPAQLPANPALFVLPPDNNPLVELAKAVSGPIVSSWREPHPLTRYINFALFRPAFARPLKPRLSGEAIIESPYGPLAFTTERREVRYLVLGFETFPYLGRENLPVSVFTMNLLDWFFHGSGAERRVTGAPLIFSAVQQGTVLLTPRGDKIPLHPGTHTFPVTHFQGLYQVERGSQRELFAVNLDNKNESDLRQPTPIPIREASSAADHFPALFSLWPYLLLISLFLLLIEWFVNPRPIRNPSQLRSPRLHERATIRY